MARTQYATTSKYGMPIFDGSSTEDPGSLVPEGYSLDKAYQDQEPADYLHTRTTRGAGKDGMVTKNGRAAYYKIEKPVGPATTAPTPEPEAPAEPAKDKGPIVHSPEVAQAKERVAAYKIDGNAGSTFNTEASAPAEAATAGTNGVSFAPGKIDTQAYNPNPSKKEAQNFADKYKLNLMEQAVPGS